VVVVVLARCGCRRGGGALPADFDFVLTAVPVVAPGTAGPTLVLAVVGVTDGVVKPARLCRRGRVVVGGAGDESLGRRHLVDALQICA
jgi:hypothetical protein